MNLPDGYNLLKLSKTDSTNEEAKRLIKTGAAHNGMVIMAEEQSAGHGRYGRIWQSPKGNLYASILLKLDGDLKKIAQLSFVAALSVGQTLAEIMPKECLIQYKWPNDVLVNGAKISGILLESVQNGWFVIGIGINISTHPEGLLTPVININQCGVSINPEELLVKLVLFFDKSLNLWQNAGFSPIRSGWLAAAYKLNEEIAVNLSDKKLSGIFNGINIEGELELLAGGEKKFISSGEVFF